MRFFTSLAIGLLILTSSCSRNFNKLDSYIGFDVPIDTIDSFIENKVKELKIPGLSVAFIEDGEVVHYRTLGFSNLEKKVSVNKNTIFEAASLSKSVFAFFVMTYVDDGKLDLDKPLYQYLPYEDISHDDRYKKITARMILSHRSGFPNWRQDFPENKLFIDFEPGTDFLYSGEGYQYLAKVLLEIDQTDWKGLEQNFQSKICQPLGMTHTVFLQNEFTKSHKAEPYDEDGNWISPDRDFDQDVRDQFIAPASIHTESIDFSKWMIGLMNNKILSEESYEEMFKIHSLAHVYDGITVDYTLGFYKPRIPLTNIYSHGGNNYGFTAFFTIDPKKKWGFVLFTNSEYGEQLGGELTLYMMAGPDDTKLYVLVIAIALTIITILFILIRWLVKYIRKKRS